MTGGLVLGEALNLFIPAEQMIFGLAVWLLFFVCVFAHRKSRYGLPVFLFVAGMFAGVLRMGAEQTVFSREEEFFWEEYEDGVVLQGIVQSVKEKDGTLEVVLKNCETEDADGETLRSVLCYLNEDSEFPAVGEKIRVFGEGKAADPARNPGVFDHQLYCRAKGISGIIYADGYTGMGGKAHIVSDSLYRIRRQLSGRLKLIALPEDAGILSAVLLGEKEDLDSAVYELYRKNGISHLLAISGLHISIVGLGIWKLFRKGGAGFWISGIFAGGFLIAYGMMVGSGPSVVRAVSMAGLSFLAAVAGRTYDLPTAMCIPALGLLLTHPYLLTQASFQLSFLAVISLVYPGRLFSARGETFFTNEKFSAAASAFFVSLSLQMVTAPVVCWHSFGIPVYGVFLNLLVIPLMTYVVLSGFIGLGLSFLSVSAGGAMLGGAHYILKLYEVVCNGIGKLPGAELVLGQPEVWKIGCYYGLVVSGAIIYERGMKIAEKFHEKKHKSKEKSEESVLNLWKTRILIDRKHRLVFLCAAWLLAFFFLLPSRPAGLFVTFLDVGQGDGIVLRCASRAILVDCGSSQQKSVGEKVLVPYLRSQGVTYVDLAVMTHGDQDHINGIRYLLEHPESGIRLGGLMMPKAGNDEIYGKMAELAKEQEIPVYYAAAGDRIENIAGKGMYMECLSPEGEEKFSDRNEESLVFRVTYDRFSMMLMGDLETGGEENLVGSGVLSPVTVLKAGHHGSATSSGESFLEKLSPEITVLSYGRKNRYGHPAKEVKERLGNIGSEILETGISGAVMIETDGKKMKVRTMLPPDAD
nr:DNA internalization-related competence protein ComEC/Rec2 [Clostridium sp. AM30-24]